MSLSRHTSAQAPFATLLCCSDSRVPPEIIFDAGIGELFVVRNAGNIAGPSEIGSIEFAVSNLGCPLVVVMGHSSCGAVTAAVNPEPSANKPSSELADIVETIRSGIDLDSVADDDRIAMAVRQNISSAVQQLQGSAVLQEAAALGKLTVVGAEYSLETGVVDFFD